MKANTVSMKKKQTMPAKKLAPSSKKVTNTTNRKSVTTKGTPARKPTNKAVKKAIVKKGSVKKTNYTVLFYKLTTYIICFGILMYCLANPVPGV